MKRTQARALLVALKTQSTLDFRPQSGSFEAKGAGFSAKMRRHSLARSLSPSLRSSPRVLPSSGNNGRDYDCAEIGEVEIPRPAATAPARRTWRPPLRDARHLPSKCPRRELQIETRASSARVAAAALPRNPAAGTRDAPAGGERGGSSFRAAIVASRPGRALEEWPLIGAAEEEEAPPVGGINASSVTTLVAR